MGRGFTRMTRIKTSLLVSLSNQIRVIRVNPRLNPGFLQTFCGRWDSARADEILFRRLDLNEPPTGRWWYFYL
jgi:hypothetical protein